MKGKFISLFLITLFIFLFSCSSYATQKNSINSDFSDNKIQQQSDIKPVNEQSIRLADSDSIVTADIAKDSSVDNSQAASAEATDDEKEIEVEGKAAISKVTNDKVKAEEDATKDAIRNAVEQGVGTFVSSQTMTSKFKLISDKIYTKAEGYVKSYNKIGKREEDGVMIVKICAIVKAGAIKNDLIAIGVLKSQLKFPTMMVIGKEKLAGVDSDNFVVGNILNDAFLEKTFDLVDKDQIEALAKRDVEGALDDMNLAATLARRFRADIIVTYKASVNDAGTDSVYGQNLHFANVNIQAKVIDVSSARLLCAENANDKGGVDGNFQSAADQALTRAGKKISQPLIDKIIKNWQDKAVGAGQWVEVRVTGIKFKDQQTLISALKKTSGINNVKDPQMEKDVVLFAVQGTITGYDLAKKISEIPNLNIEIESYAQNSVTAKMGN